MSLRAPVSRYQYRGHVIVTPPASEPVTLQSVKDALIVTGSTDDAILTEYIAVAREYIEETTGLAMITQVWRLSLDAWPNGREEWWDGWRQGSRSELYGGAAALELPRYPLLSITTVTVYDEDGDDTAVTVADTFDVDIYQRPGRMVLKRGAVWPVALRAANAIQIVYSAGFGASGTLVPAPLRSAVRQMAAYLYTHRGDGCDVGDAYVDSGAASLADKYRVARI
jgi:uncharacterized phiE125 gp8 family phage protein